MLCVALVLRVSEAEDHPTDRREGEQADTKQPPATEAVGDADQHEEGDHDVHPWDQKEEDPTPQKALI